jgi:uncharacterized SAM-binding protein YcdF (DUF218 family)
VTPRRVLVWGLRLLTLAVVLGVVVFGYTAFRVWQVGEQDHRPHADAILVLGAAQFNGRPSATLRARLDHAITLYDAHLAPRIVTVGGNRPGDTFTEAEAGASYLEQHGVPPSAVVVVGRGADTLLSLEAAVVVFRDNGWHSAVLVTDPWHSLRARTMARDLHLTATTSPTWTGPASHGLPTEVRYIARESAALLYYQLFHRASAPGPAAT